MFRHFIIQLLAVLFSLTVSAAYLPAHAAVLKNVSEYEGERCNTPPKGSGIIVGYFWGFKYGTSISNESYFKVSRYRCFKNMELCKGWLYTMNSLYSEAGPPRVSRCFIR